MGSSSAQAHAVLHMQAVQQDFFFFFYVFRNVLLVTAKYEVHVVTISVRLMGLHSQSYRTNRLPCNMWGVGGGGLEGKEGGGHLWMKMCCWTRLKEKPVWCKRCAAVYTWSSLTHSARSPLKFLLVDALLCGAPRMLRGFWMPRAPVLNSWVYEKGGTSGEGDRWKAPAAE